ncbi:MAG: 50S ribosomal protein L24 [Candidatus Aureabacteria bacterium]|nr:50S ribosomal protein L24 [Candidatus Auribacterota bacterium]
MRITTHIRKDDIVIATAGRERFTKKTGRVLKVFPAAGRAVIEGFNMVKRHMRPTQKNPKGGIVEKERSISLSSVMPYCGKCQRGVRVGHRSLTDGTKVRVCRKCGEVVGKS